MCCSNAQASIWLDMSPSAIEGKLPAAATKQEITRFVHNIFAVAKAMQPAVIYIDQIEKFFIEPKKKKKSTAAAAAPPPPPPPAAPAAAPAPAEQKVPVWFSFLFFMFRRRKMRRVVCLLRCVRAFSAVKHHVFLHFSFQCRSDFDVCV